MALTLSKSRVGGVVDNLHLLAGGTGIPQGFDVLDELPELGELVIGQIEPLDIDDDGDRAGVP